MIDPTETAKAYASLSREEAIAMCGLLMANWTNEGLRIRAMAKEAMPRFVAGVFESNHFDIPYTEEIVRELCLRIDHSIPDRRWWGYEYKEPL